MQLDHDSKIYLVTFGYSKHKLFDYYFLVAQGSSARAIPVLIGKEIFGVSDIRLVPMIIDIAPKSFRCLQDMSYIADEICRIDIAKVLLTVKNGKYDDQNNLLNFVNIGVDLLDALKVPIPSKFNEIFNFISADYSSHQGLSKSYLAEVVNRETTLTATYWLLGVLSAHIKIYDEKSIHLASPKLGSAHLVL